ncbi:MAG: glycine--tRNA ligase subunit beta [Betaproteobacteria bacterium]|nr:glycine--tRNA ligase subunit beta [Betaproteobacteria bacterium]MDE2151648.1 glycine--tRNA ligase subunit beta [Betaproteobacteria bacterium]
MTAANLLVELFVEELPPKALPHLGRAFASGLSEALRAQGLLLESSATTAFASPRRLGAHIGAVLPKAPDRALHVKLMPASVGLDAAGQPSAALRKKLAALGLDESAASRVVTEGEGKASTLYIDTVAPGAALPEGLQRALEDTLAELPIPKLMSYQLGDGWSTVRFVRPAHGLVALHGADLVPVQALGLQAGRRTRGHRFEARSEFVELAHADDYEHQLLEQGAVIAGFERRRESIATQLEQAAREIGGGLRPLHDEALLDEVCALVEKPRVLACRFDPEYLEVPQECLILTMKANQKYFPLLDGQGRLSNRFLVVSNIDPQDPTAVIQGNERVVRPRLADARFFYDQDRKKSLEQRVEGLQRVVYHARLGSQAERARRVAHIAAALAQRLDPALVPAVRQAAALAKADLLTEMVGEFPELQGIMGRYYALHDGLEQQVAEAIEDHYRPRFAGDALPRGSAGLCLALADKLETLCGLWGIGERPSGDKDPFALRRHALGVVRMLMERARESREWPLDELLRLASEAFAGVEAFQDPSAALRDFIDERMANLLREQGYGAREVDAVLGLRPQWLGDVVARLDAVRAFAALPEAQALAAANKRVANILKKSPASGGPALDPALLREPAEQALERVLRELRPQAGAAQARGDHTEALRCLAALKAPVDAFFDDVMVNVEDAALRANRLALLEQLQHAMRQVADLACLAG